MEKYEINGGRRLSGSIEIPGAKNSVLPVLAASVISGKRTVIENCPRITDVDNTLKILEKLGCRVCREKGITEIDSSTLESFYIDGELTDKMRSSTVFAGALLARGRTVKMGYPGGCVLGMRPIDLHINAFREMGVEVNEEEDYLLLDGRKMKGCDIRLSFPSVGATENIMLAAMGINERVRIYNAAREPEIEDLAELLRKMGGKITGAGTDVIELEGANSFRDVTHRVISDRIVAATYLTAVYITGGEAEMLNVNPRHIASVTDIMQKMGAELEAESGILKIKGNKKIKSPGRIVTSPYPGFPTDAQSLAVSLLSVAEGDSSVAEKIFECRFRHAEELAKMGADINIENCVAYIKGVKRLHGARVSAPDLRSGAALTVAALAAEGKSEISNVCYIERGYESLAGGLASLGADIVGI